MVVQNADFFLKISKLRFGKDFSKNKQQKASVYILYTKTIFTKCKQMPLLHTMIQKFNVFCLHFFRYVGIDI